MDKNEVKGTARKVTGRVQDAVGGLTGDTETQAEGKVNEAYGQAQKTFGAAADEIRDTVTEQPLKALLLVGAIGLVVGYLARR